MHWKSLSCSTQCPQTANQHGHLEHLASARNKDLLDVMKQNKRKNKATQGPWFELPVFWLQWLRTSSLNLSLPVVQVLFHGQRWHLKWGTELTECVRAAGSSLAMQERSWLNIPAGWSSVRSWWTTFMAEGNTAPLSPQPWVILHAFSN